MNDLLKIADDLYEKGNIFDAIEKYKEYLKNDKNPVIYNRIGFLYNQLNDDNYLDEQIFYYRKALELKPNYTGAIRNLALTYPHLGKFEHSKACFEKLLQSKEFLPDDYYAYACLLIRLGNFEKGWMYYESRFQKGFGRTDYPQIDKPRWSGEKIKNKTLLIQYEQGFGDTIQFLRFVDLVKPFAGKIIFRVQDELVELIKNNINVEVVGCSEKLEDINFDFHTPLMSLPLILKIQKDNIPQKIIIADTQKILSYKKKYFLNDNFKIGITWSGSQTGNSKRNIPLKTFLLLQKNIPNAKLYSFQKGAAKRQLNNFSNEIIDLGSTFNDFSDTAAALENVDLFVTSDNSVLNLAGMMNKKTYLLLNKFAEWRWFLDENSTPWYNSVKIIRKKNENDVWDFSMKRVIEEVNKNASN